MLTAFQRTEEQEGLRYNEQKTDIMKLSRDKKMAITYQDKSKLDQ
ncbi:hypothetical protein E2C01_071090 [Portunus trituberculatus]|uniref:Uncharacterized protein n=1 Tax=Portunus trituberculatus TaxID=210409 RepID=A0A5B7I3Y1_PORTR|nr:hypothetical protein [Portunus trituberculatus]